MTNDTSAILDQAKAWAAQDPDTETKAELESLIALASSQSQSAESAQADLKERFSERLAFGTAGLRGALGAGPNRMNRVLVAQAAAGLAAYLVEKSDGAEPSVVIGYDGRKNSEIFAKDSAEIMAGAGVRAIILPRLLPTPVLAFAVRHLDASAGVMVTASHNPPQDNGYKVYLGEANNGSQIVSPADAEIAAHIETVALNQTFGSLTRGEYRIADESVIDEYVKRTATVALTAGGETPTAQPRIVYTAMHGVGWETFSKVWQAAGFEAPTTVDAQLHPDAAFPTVAFPNPEEPGAMDLSFETARKTEADLIIANDPDADRLAIAISDPSAKEGYRRLTGNEVGLLLGWQSARNAVETAGEQGANGSLACSIVSSPGLQAIAEEYGLSFKATLTGFKWISRVPDMIFGFEEALGYLVNAETVRDKDGISVAVAFASLAANLQSTGRTVADHLDEFVEKFGCFASSQISIRVTDLARINVLMRKLRDDPPATIGTSKVDHIDDLSEGFGELPPSDVLRIVLGDGSRIMVRPSGTEPKLKVYIDTVAQTGTVPERRATATATAVALDTAMRSLLA